ncbi:MAG: PAS domain S-box protein [Anaerolineae bacterium]|nr:PAS domain S-box protein [Anaerolineae bacterium]
MMVLDGHGHVLIANAPLASLLNSTCDQLVGRPVTHLFPELQIDASTRLALQRIQRFSYQFDQNGSTIHLEIQLLPLEQIADGPPNWLVTVRDITESKLHTQSLEEAFSERTHELQKTFHELFERERHQRAISDELRQANLALHIEKQRTEAILHSIADGLIVADQQGVVTLINPAAARMLDIPAEHLIGTALEESAYVNVRLFTAAIFDPARQEDTVEFELFKNDLEAERACWQTRDCADAACQALQNDQVACWQISNKCVLIAAPSHTSTDCPILTSLARLTLHAHRSSILDENGQPTGIVVALSDITHLKELDRLKSQFVSSVSHELRTPLTNIKMYLSLLKKGRPEKRERYLQVITTEAERLERLIQDVLDLSRIDAASGQAKHEPLSMPDLVNRVVEMHRPRAESQDIVLECSIPPNLARFVGDSTQYIQVLTNLLSNAVQYTPAGGQVQVGLSTIRNGRWNPLATAPTINADLPPGDWGALWVSDTGIGIPPEDQPHIYERFFRGSAEKLDVPGTGLGLAIVREIVQQHNGHIFLHSQPNVGSTFVVLLPAILEEEIRPRIMMVDDDETIAGLVARIVKRLDCDLEWIADGAAGFAKASANPPDLMILDLSLPGMDGMTILSLLRTVPSTKAMPILVLTGWGNVDENYLKRLGANALLKKPFAAKIFAELTTKLLDLKTTTQGRQ